MVSIGTPGRQFGGTLHDVEASSSYAINHDDTDLLLHAHQLTKITDDNRFFQPVSTIGIALLEIVMLVALIGVTFLLPIFNDGEVLNEFNSYSLLVIIQFIFWCYIVASHKYMNCYHRWYKRQGYLIFYSYARFPSRVPLYSFSFGNGLMLLTVILLESYCPKVELCGSRFLPPISYIQAIITIESVISVVALTVYLSRVRRFNLLRLPPDVHCDEIMTSYTQPNLSEIGFRSSSSTNLEDTLEKQADMISHLHEHNGRLAKKVLQLSAELGKRSIINSHSQSNSGEHAHGCPGHLIPADEPILS